MKIRTIIVVALWLVAGLLAVLNWATISEPTSLNLLVARVDAPLGIILLGFAGLLSVVYFALLVKAEGAAMLESRRMLKEMEKIRRLADDAEASRVKELRDAIDHGLADLRRRIDDVARGVESRPHDEPGPTRESA